METTTTVRLRINLINRVGEVIVPKGEVIQILAWNEECQSAIIDYQGNKMSLKLLNFQKLTL